MGHLVTGLPEPLCSCKALRINLLVQQSEQFFQVWTVPPRHCLLDLHFCRILPGKPVTELCPGASVSLKGHKLQVCIMPFLRLVVQGEMSLLAEKSQGYDV